jgi:hypothetical protein
MKISTLVFLLLIGNIQGSMPPQKVINAMKQKFPSALNIKWQKQKYGDFWKASFILSKRNATASFRSDAQWFQSTIEITADELNTAIKSKIKEEHPGCLVLSAIMTELTYTTGYLVRMKCGDEIIEIAYDYQGMHPPKIT